MESWWPYLAIGVAVGFLAGLFRLALRMLANLW
jgi:hypothetical protein